MTVNNPTPNFTVPQNPTEPIACAAPYYGWQLHGEPMVFEDSLKHKRSYKCQIFCVLVVIAVFLTGGLWAALTYEQRDDSKSFAVPYIGQKPDNKPLKCHSEHRSDIHYSRSIVICGLDEVCASSVDRSGTMSRGCTKDSGNQCEYVYMNDNGIKKPKYSAGKQIEQQFSFEHLRQKRSLGQRRRPVKPGQDFHFCYCRQNLCNSLSTCECQKRNRSNRNEIQSKLFLVLLFVQYFVTVI